MRFNLGAKKTLIVYFGLILATAFFAIAYFSSYAALQQVNYAAEFDVLPTDMQTTDSGFSLIDVTEALVSGQAAADGSILVSPLGIGKIPSLSDMTSEELKMYDVLQDNDGAISDKEKGKLTRNLHWQEYITKHGDTISSVAKEFKMDAAKLRRANCLAGKKEQIPEGYLLYIPDAPSEVESTRAYVYKLKKDAAAFEAKRREEQRRAELEKNRMHPLAYVVQKGDSLEKIARRFGISTKTILSMNSRKKISTGCTLVIPRMGNRYVDGIYVKADRNDTASTLAKKYKSSSTSILVANGMSDKSAKFRNGAKVFIPGGKIPEITIADKKSDRYKKTESGKRTRYQEDTSGGSFSGSFRWPCSGHVTSRFGYRRSPFRRSRTVFHAGVDIGAPRGTPVVAAADGVVIHSGWKGGYGKTIMISHGGGVVSLYGHNSALVAQVGTRVSKGQLIARVGSTGHSTGNHCHFEVRRGGRPVNPFGSR